MTVRSPFILIPLVFGPSGAIKRVAFLCGGVALAGFAFLADAGLSQLRSGAGCLDFLFLLTIAWGAGCLSRKRLHDLGCSGVAIAYFLGFYVLVVLAAPLMPALQAMPTLSGGLLAGPGLAWILWLGTARSAAVAVPPARRGLQPA